MKTIITAAIIATAATTTQAGQYKGELEGTYVPVAGVVETMEIGTTQREQLGDLTIFFERKGWLKLPHADRRRIKRFFFLEGGVKGVMNPATFTVDHVIVSQGRAGVIYTKDDFLIPTEGDPFCASGTPLKGMETVNIVKGLGEFSGLKGGTLKLKATINNCPGDASYGRNDFSVSTDGYLQF